MSVYLNRIGTAVPVHQVHEAFCLFAASLFPDPHQGEIFHRMVDRAQIERRWSVLCPDPVDPTRGVVDGFYRRGDFPSTGARMRRYALEAPALAFAALDDLALDDTERASITHLIVASCTGFSAPGVDHAIREHLRLRPSVERTIVGFMGCQAAITAMKLAWHVLRGTPDAKVLVVNLELCSLHLQQRPKLSQNLAFLLFGDGCSAALFSSAPRGLRVDGFHAAVVAEAAGQITWHIGDDGFDMVLSGQVPATLMRALPDQLPVVLDGLDPTEIELWAIHPGGRSILDAVQDGLALPQGALAYSRDVLKDFGNMSSPTVMFVLRAMMDAAHPGQSGCAMAFGPGLSAEMMRFSTV